jgi:cytosine deaminase
MDLLIRNVVIAETDGDGIMSVDIACAGGRIAEIGHVLGGSESAEIVDGEGCLAVPGLVETHIHLDKSCILERCRLEQGTLAEAIEQASAAKRDFTVEDIFARGARTLEKCILQGTTRMRTHVEVDPVIGLKGLEAVKALRERYGWAIDVEVCVFPQEGLFNNPGTEHLMVAALNDGATVIGGCPYTDSDPMGQIDRVFELARDYDVDIDFHLDFDLSPDGMTVGRVCENAEGFGWGGRVAIGHVSKLSALPAEALATVSQRLSDAGVALTILPSTDLFLMGGDVDHNVPRGVAPIHRVETAGVCCSLSTNNVLNPFTPFGDGSLVRMANLYANIAQLATPTAHRRCLDYVTHRAARLMRLGDYGFEVGKPADLVLLDCTSPEQAVGELAQPLAGFKGGRRTFTRPRAMLHAP